MESDYLWKILTAIMDAGGERIRHLSIVAMRKNGQGFFKSSLSYKYAERIAEHRRTRLETYSR